MKTRDSCTCSASPIFAVAYCGESKSQNRTISCTTTMHRKRQTWTRLGTVRMMLVEQIDTASSPHPVHPPGCCAIHQPGRAPIGPSTRVAVARRPAGPSVPTSAQIDTATHHPHSPTQHPTGSASHRPVQPQPAGTLHGWHVPGRGPHGSFTRQRRQTCLWAPGAFLPFLRDWHPK